MEVSFGGQSMLPVIREGDMLSIELFSEPQSLDTRSLGEVVVFKDGGEWISHRVIQYKEKKYTKGDWSYCVDQQMPVWGKVVAINGSSKRLQRGVWLARLSSLDLSYSNRFARRVRKVFSLVLNIF